MKKYHSAAGQAKRLWVAEYQNPIFRFFFSLVLLALIIGFNACTEDCPEGFKGKNCDQEIIPTRMEIEQIEVHQFPEKQPDGTFWDAGQGGADLYPDLKIQIWQMTNNVSVLLLGETYVEENAIGYALYNFEERGLGNIPIPDPEATYRVILYDDDGAPQNDDLIIGPTFSPFAPGELFPSIITITAQNTLLELRVKYYWD